MRTIAGVVMGTTMYEELLCEMRPEVIETSERYEEVCSRLAEPVRKRNRRTVSETRLMEAACAAG
jgi:hypothetical protein